MRLFLPLATIIVVLVLAADQASKRYVVHWLELEKWLREENVLYKEVIPGFFNLRMAWNQGINFGLFASDSEAMRWGLVALALAISAWIWVWASRQRENRMMQASAGFLVGGALGNVIDRLTWGAVADFINVTCCGIDNPFAFNVADAAIFIGAIGLILFGGEKTTRDDPGDLR